MIDKFFLDTNILIYSVSPDFVYKQEISRQLIKQSLESSQGCISYQVIQEFLNAATTKFKTILSKEECLAVLTEILHPLCSIYPNTELFMNAVEIRDRWKFGFYDSLIVSAALEGQCSILYTEDLQHNQKIGTLKIINPFVDQ